MKKQSQSLLTAENAEIAEKDNIFKTKPISIIPAVSAVSAVNEKTKPIRW
jgi:hypothetical protein